MTPNDLYALPTTRAEPWYDEDRKLKAFFGLEFGIDRERAQAEDASAVQFAEKLYCNLDWGERSVSYTAVFFEDRPVGILLTGGRGQQDAEETLVTDAEAYRAARSYMARYVDEVQFTAVAADQELEALQHFYGAALVGTQGQARLVRVDRVASDGSLLFDDKAFSSAFHATVRPEFKSDSPEAQQGLQGQRMRKAAIGAMLQAVPRQLDAKVLDVESLTGGMPEHEGDWHAIAVRGPDGTYTIGVPSWSKQASWFTWASEVCVQRVGPAEMCDQLGVQEQPPTAPHM